MTRPRDIADSINRINSSAADATAVTIDSSEQVGIGTTSPDTLLNLESAAPTIRLAPTTQNNSASIELGVLNSSTNAYAKIDSHNATNYDSNIRFFTNAAGSTTQVERMRILSGGGITFNGDTSTDNALDDYEIGSWTPTYSVSGGSFNMSLQLGTYVKVGEIVTATARVRGQRVGGSGTLTVTGLPYSTRNIANVHGAIAIGYTNGWATSPQAGFTATNGTTISFKKNGSTTNPNSNLVDDITEADVNTSSTSNNDIIFSVTYVAN